MFLFPKQIVFILVLRNLLVLYTSKGRILARLDISENFIRHLEVVDSAALEKLFNDFFQKILKTHAQITILLSQKLVFQKIFPAQDFESKKSEFLEKVPLDPSVQAVKTLDFGKQKAIMVTNQEIYSLFVKVLSNLGFKVEAVLPLNLLGNSIAENLEGVNILEAVRKNAALTKVGNFLTNNQVTDDQDIMKEKDQPTSSHYLSPWLFILIPLLISAGLFCTAYFLYKRPINPPIESTINHISPSPQSTKFDPSPSPTTIIFKTKEQFLVEVLNGTGRGGEAVRVRDKLLELGYVQVEVGNSEEILENTAVRISQEVSDEIREELLSNLEELFQQEPVLSTESPSYKDIQIITGQ